MLQLVTPHTAQPLTCNFEGSEERVALGDCKAHFFHRESRERTEVNDCHYRRGAECASRVDPFPRRVVHHSSVMEGTEVGGERGASSVEGGTRDSTRALTHTHYYRPSTGERKREKEGGNSRGGGGRTPKIFLRKTFSLASFGKKGTPKNSRKFDDTCANSAGT